MPKIGSDLLIINSFSFVLIAVLTGPMEHIPPEEKPHEKQPTNSGNKKLLNPHPLYYLLFCFFKINNTKKSSIL